MTTLAYKDGILVTDSFVSAGEIFAGRVEKARIVDGHIVAFVGNLEHAAHMLNCLENGKEAREKEREASLMRVNKDGKVEFKDTMHLDWFEISAPFHAAGSGRDLALGAMAHGASAYEAVEIACAYDANSGIPLYQYKIEDLSDKPNT